MKLTIGVTACDRDWRNIPALLAQAEELVETEHEVIIIDNREEFLDAPAEWTADFTFGRNAYQFMARRKIIELARGDYIWFVDGDDGILGLDDFAPDADIIVYRFMHRDPDGGPDVPCHDHITDGPIAMEPLTAEFTGRLCGALWNKLIRRSALTGCLDTFPEAEIVHGEDTLFLLQALRNSSSVRGSSRRIYLKTNGISDRTSYTAEEFRHLFIGKDAHDRIMAGILDGDTDLLRSFAESDLRYFCGPLRNSAPEVIEEAVETMASGARREYVRKGLSQFIQELEGKERIRAAYRPIKKIYGGVWCGTSRQTEYFWNPETRREDSRTVDFPLVMEIPELGEPDGDGDTAENPDAPEEDAEDNGDNGVTV